MRERPVTFGLLAVAIVGTFTVRGNAVWLDWSVIVGIYALLALSVGLSYGQAGILSMAQGGLAAIGAYAAAIVTLKLGWSPYIGLLLALVLPTGISYGLARIVTRLAPLSVALATLALGTLIEIVLRNWDRFTGGYVGLTGIPAPGPIHSPADFQIATWVSVLIAVFLYENLMHSAYGRALRTIKHDRSRAIADGVPVSHLLSSAFALSGAMAGLAGWLYAHYVTFLDPASLGTTLSISVLLMAVVGGAGFVIGPIVGAVLLTVLTRMLPAQEVQGLFYGGALIVILLVAREGIVGALAPLFRRRKRAV
ncbi:MAG: branched-chain amino acid ABC transporter permease [Candidatus Velthaea sp.]